MGSLVCTTLFLASYAYRQSEISMKLITLDYAISYCYWPTVVKHGLRYITRSNNLAQCELQICLELSFWSNQVLEH